MKKIIQLICTLVILAVFVAPTSATRLPTTPGAFTAVPVNGDFDPLVDNITVTVTIDEIRELDTIDAFSDPDFYVKIMINDEEFESAIWENMKYVSHQRWSASCEVPKDVEFVNVTIELWDKDISMDHLCDISPEEGTLRQCRTAELVYSIATGVWWGDDELGDLSGYGRLSGVDDNTMYQADRDAELWFSISQNDYDGDGLPYWVETEMYNTSPLIDNRGEDLDNDGVPIEWEHTFGLTYFAWGHQQGYYVVYDPNVTEDHVEYDDDADGLTNIEEYKTWQWGSDPFRQDIFIELDQMELGPQGQGSFVPNESFDLLRDSHARHHIVWHIDDGRLGGGETVPFAATLTEQMLSSYYWNYFMHGDAQNWRRGVFRWAIVSYNGTWANGFAFSSRVNGVFALDCFLLASSYHDSRVKHVPFIDSLIRKTFSSEEQRAIIYAGAMMHENGHLLNIRAPGVDRGAWPWQVDYWRFARYQSVMNYRYIYTDLIDYSDGSHGKNDYDDWGTIDLTYFNPRTHW
ncbi:MAG: hypothetical protein JXA00_06290 [Candidatus Thermoplasmatota archaeon]|nr:hypothetical protein [Candidatus Thermoplasmatota archaeon]